MQIVVLCVRNGKAYCNVPKEKPNKEIANAMPKKKLMERIRERIDPNREWKEIVFKAACEVDEELQKVSKGACWIKKALLYSTLILSSPIVQKMAMATVNTGKAVATLKGVFIQLMQIAMAIGEPILWFYALTAIIMMATGKNKVQGLSRLKTVMYSYVFLRFLPTFFTLLGWLSDVINEAFKGFVDNNGR